MPNELLVAFIEKIIESNLDNWVNVFEFDREFNKAEFKKDINGICLSCKGFNNLQTCIIESKKI